MGETTAKNEIDIRPLITDRLRALHLRMPYRAFVARREKLKRQIQLLRLFEETRRAK
jgi:hypothetical protein